MTKASGTWQIVDDKLAELRTLVDQRWDKGDWDVALLTTGVIRTVEQGKRAAEDMRQRAVDLEELLRKLREGTNRPSPE